MEEWAGAREEDGSVIMSQVMEDLVSTGEKLRQY